jgi:cell division septal protein FtsQ
MKKGTVNIWGYKLSRKNKTVRKRTKKDGAMMLRIRAILPYAGAVILSAGIIILAAFALRQYFLTGDTFKVKHIAVDKPSGVIFKNVGESLKREYIGRNIFSVVPSRVVILLREEYPYLKMIRVRRVFPDTIEVDLIPRENFACLDTSGGVTLDRSGMILSVGEFPEGLVRIKGFNFFLSRPQPGAQLKDKGVEEALGVIDSILEKTRIRRQDLQLVDISDKNNVWVTAKDVPINLGRDDFERKIDTLRDIFSDPAIDLGGIRYIDLRFRDPVYSYKR